MKRHEVKELHYIVPIDTIPSIMAHGILCHEQAKPLNPVSIAMEGVQARRDKIVVPQGLPLHKYANLYFHARNPMLYVLRGKHRSLSVLRLSTEVLDLPDVVIADGNAASRDYTAFLPSPDGIERLDAEMVFAEYWTDSDPIEYFIKKRIKCAEVLIPKRVKPDYVNGIYVSCEEAKTKVESFGVDLPVNINSHLFFQA